MYRISKTRTVLLLSGLLLLSSSAQATETVRQYLSGMGSSDAVPWEFFCTKGRQSGEWTTIPVPSNWEQHGFGNYNYGHDTDKYDEQGLYRYRFQAPLEWNDRVVRIVFEGSMTDTEVKINGKPAGNSFATFTATKYRPPPSSSNRPAAARRYRSKRWASEHRRRPRARRSTRPRPRAVAGRRQRWRSASGSRR